MRPFSKADSPAVFEYWSSDADWARFNKSIPDGFSEEDAVRWVDEALRRDPDERPTWAIGLEGRVIGLVGLTFEQGHRIAVVGYGVHATFRGMGFSGEAAHAVVDSAFDGYSQLMRVRAHLDARNVASMRVLEKLGFLREGILRSNQYVKGELADEAVFGLLREDWRG